MSVLGVSQRKEHKIYYRMHKEEKHTASGGRQAASLSCGSGINIET